MYMYYEISRSDVSVILGDLDYLVYDYLSEITMSLMTAARLKKPEMGYAPDVIPSLTPYLHQLRERGTKVRLTVYRVVYHCV